MIRTFRLVLSVGVLLALILLLGAHAGANGKADDAAIWKPVLPEADFKPLVEQAVKGIQEELSAGSPSAKAANKARGLAVLIAVYAQSSMNRPGANAGSLAAVRDAAVKLADTIQQKKFADAAKQAEALLKADGGPAKPSLVALHKLSEREDLTTITMQLFAVRTKGGLGLGSRPAKNVDGIEARFVALGRKPLDPADLAKQADEIAHAAYATAMLAEITHALAPEKDDGKKKRADWITWSEQMRDAGVQLAEAARAKNPKDVRAAASKLNASCASCHDTYRTNE